MSEIEDLQNASKQDDTQEDTAETAEIDNEEPSSIEESDSSELSEKLSKTESEEERESIKEEEQKETPSHEKSQKEETPNSELATITRSASSDDSMPASMSGTAVKQVEPGEPRIPPATAAGAEDATQQRHVRSGPSTTVGEWNSLPVLVERLREAVELSLAAGHRRGGGGVDEPTSTSLTEPVDIDRSRARHSMEQALLTGGCDHDDLESKKDELKFLEDLLLSDIQTALSRLRETLERTDVATLAKHGGVSDPTSKLHLLRLVSSLLSRLQVPEEGAGGGGGTTRTTDIAVQSGGVPVGRRRRAVRHTIGVSAEEIAHARKQLEESSADLARLNDQVSGQRRELLLPAKHNATNSNERHVEEIHDKYTKDAINQRQSLRDKNKDSHGDVGAYRLLAPSQIDVANYADRPIAAETVNDANTHRSRRRGSVDSYQEKESDDEETAMKRANEEQSRVTKLAAALRQRAEFLSANKNNNNNNNKFTVKKSKIKRANTIDIPSYLKLQAGNLGYDNPGCILLRRPINVSDKITSNTSNPAVPPSFQPRTENDKKFLALINRNNETQAVNTAPAFVKSFGYTKRTDTSAHENWNSRFSNIKTAFDKPSAVSEESKASSKPQPSAKRSPGFAPQTSPSATHKRAQIDGTSHNSFPFANANVAKSDAGFRHAPSSLFRKIDKSQTPKSPPIHHWQRENVPANTNTLREKARIMFDRDNAQSQPPSKFNVSKNSQKSAFPRPPWLEHDKNEGKSSNMVTENGRLDYRLFCKQFAPFIGKNTTPESRKSQNIEESRKRNQHSNAHCKNVASPSEKLGATNGRAPFKIFPAQESRIEHYYPNEPRREAEGAIRDKLHSKKDTFEPAETRGDKSPFDVAFARNAAAFDATLRGGSSSVQTAVVNGDAHPEETRVLRVAPKISKDLRNNVPKIELSEQWLMPRDERSVNPTSESSYRSENPGHLILDHNRNYHPASTIDIAPNETSPFANKNACNLVKEDAACVLNPTENVVPFRTTSDHPAEEREIFQVKSQNENSFSYKPAIDNRSQIYSNYSSGIKPFESEMSNTSCEVDRQDFLRANDGALPEEQNIQNQDISADAGVVTRYTCAIATVASADIPEARSEGIRPESRESLSSSPSQLGSYSRATSSDASATENEIRRHNMLQQSLVRRLQNERTMLNDYRDALIPSQPGSFNQPSKFQSPETPPKRLEPRKLESPRRFEPPSIVTGLLSVAPSSASGMNRVTALRGQYEQPDGQAKSVQKERSPIPGDAIDSSDEYLVSCTNKPSRSIVLSKSESWHQLALSRNHHSSPRLSAQDTLPPQPPPPASTSYLPPKPKSKSPSPYRMKKQYEASSSSDSVKKMESKIRRYFDNPTNDGAAEARDSKGRRFSSRDSLKNHGLIGLSRSRTMPGICDESTLRLVIPTAPQISVSSLNTADVDKVFDDIFEEATKADDHHF
nr:PREDICTED: uncharacterized protein LOC105674839 isoform X1 [Linepithema humile]XP_012226859.1 PREDICTED: uncharacterized protein LOC105674839 isoform X1 [Linepithema humile]